MSDHLVQVVELQPALFTQKRSYKEPIEHAKILKRNKRLYKCYYHLSANQMSLTLSFTYFASPGLQVRHEISRGCLVNVCCMYDHLENTTISSFRSGATFKEQNKWVFKSHANQTLRQFLLKPPFPPIL